MKRYENYLHEIDSVNYPLDLEVEDLNDSEELRANLGAYCLSEDSANRYFGIENKIYNLKKSQNLRSST